MSKCMGVVAMILTVAVTHWFNVGNAQAEEPAAPTTLPAASSMTIDGNTIRLTGVVTSQSSPEGKPLVLNFTTNYVKATYLGVEASEADDTLRAQLKLPQGVGLAVRHVDETSPAHAAGVQQHDVLYKLNDQLLINPEQFAVLVRTFKPDEKVELTVIREAQPVKLTATLVQKDVEALRGNTDYILDRNEKVLKLLTPYTSSRESATSNPFAKPTKPKPASP